MKYLSIPFMCMLLYACHQPTERLEGYEVHGIDVSRHQLEIDWDTVAAQRIDFAFIKASEGLELVDICFEHNWNAIKEKNIKRGAYHFFHPKLSSFDQAMNFINAVPLEYGDLPPVLDFEVINGASKMLVINRLQSWLDIVERHYGIRPIIYTNQKLYKKYILHNFDHYPIWMARYNTETPIVKQGWHFWQYGNRGQVNGIVGDVDLNVFRGSRLELEEMCLAPRAVLSAK